MKPTATSQGRYPQDAKRLVSDLVSRITYKPGFKIEVLPFAPPADMVCIKFSTEVEVPTDSALETVEIQSILQIAWQIAIDMDEWLLAQRIFYGVMDLERHEIQRWFKLDGALFDDTHQKRYHA